MRAMQERNRLLEAPLAETKRAHQVKRISLFLPCASYQGDEQPFSCGAIALLQEPRRQLNRLMNCRQGLGCDYGVTLADIFAWPVRPHKQEGSTGEYKH